ISRGLLNERDPGRVEREIVGELVERRSEGENFSLADLAFEQKRRAVVQPCQDFRFRGCNFDGLIEFYAVEPLYTARDGVAGVDIRDREEAFAFTSGVG